MLARLPLPDADVRLDATWLPTEAADRALALLLDALPWSNHPVRLFGREIPAPRLSAWIGDPDAAYRYSGIERAPLPWPPLLASMRDRLAAELRTPFNSVLANLYRDGRDAMGWHADDEPELGPEPVIASLSLGAERRFVLRHRRDDTRLVLALPHGSLLVMAGATQRAYRHALPRTARPVDARINLTFRQVRPQR